jgi:hypothetical protein
MAATSWIVVPARVPVGAHASPFSPSVTGAACAANGDSPSEIPAWTHVTVSGRRTSERFRILYRVARVLRLTPARLDEATAAAIKQLLFDEWLAERRRAARIEWYWGPCEPCYMTAEGKARRCACQAWVGFCCGR